MGVLRVQSNAALGTVAGGTSVVSGAALEIDGSGLAIAEPITSLIGTGVGAAGALRNLANDNTWSGAITLGAGGARINSDAGTLTLSGGVTGNTRPLTVGGAGNTTIGSVIATTTGTPDQGRLRHAHPVAPPTPTPAATTVSAGMLKLGIANAISTSSALTVSGGRDVRPRRLQRDGRLAGRRR